MRRSYNSQFIFTDQGKFNGIYFGLDSVAEHERGIKEILESFGIRPNDEKDFTAKCFPKESMHIEQRNGFIFILFSHYSNENWNYWIEKSALNPENNEDLVCAWSSQDFGIRLSEKLEDLAIELFEAFENCEVCIGINDYEDVPADPALTILLS